MLKPRARLRSTLPVAPMAVVAMALLAAGGVGLAATAHAHDSRADGGLAASDLHTINVTLPDGAAARVTYQGTVAPRVALVPVGVAGAAFAPIAVGAVPGDPFAADPLFAALERQQVEMVRQMNAMRQEALRQAVIAQGAAQASAAGAPGAVRVGSLPAGASFRYSVTSISNGAHGCTQTVEWRSDGSGKEPQVIRAASGDCDAAPASGKAKGFTPTSGMGRAEGSPAKPAPVAPARAAPAAPSAGGSNT